VTLRRDAHVAVSFPVCELYCGKHTVALQFAFSGSSGLFSLHAAIKWIVSLVVVIRSVELHSRRVCMRI
jgi:hypothetical protein